MTLPNRPGYSVSDKKNSPNQQTSQQQTQPPPQADLSSKLPVQPQQQIHSQYDMEQLSGMAPPQQAYYPPNLFSQQPDMLRMGERTQMQQQEDPYKMSDPFRQPLSDNTQSRVEEMTNRKSYIKYHRLLPSMIELLAYCKKEGIIPPIASDADLQASRMTDFGLDDFINSQGIEVTQLFSEDQKKNQERAEFVEKLEQLKMKYNEELEKLNRVLSEFCTRAVAILQEQAQFRTVTELETHLKVLGIQQKFDYVRNQLRQNVCNAILVLQKQYNQLRKKRRTLSKRATEGLTNWFFEHLNDPYPSEEEKSMLAAHGGLTITQVNNWFGNKSSSSYTPSQNPIQTKMSRGRKQETGGTIHPQQQPGPPQYSNQFAPQFFQQPHPHNSSYYQSGYYNAATPTTTTTIPTTSTTTTTSSNTTTTTTSSQPSQFSIPTSTNIQHSREQSFRNANANANAQYNGPPASDRAFWAQFSPHEPSSSRSDGQSSSSQHHHHQHQPQPQSPHSYQQSTVKPQHLIPSISQQLGLPSTSSLLQSFPAYKSANNESYGLSNANANGQ